MTVRLVNRIRFRKDDPLRYLHVPKKKRGVQDVGSQSTALDVHSGADIVSIDREEIRNQ